MDPELKAAAEVVIAQAFAEDISTGDCTTQAIIPQTMHASAEIVCKQDAVVCGLEIAALVFQKYDSNLIFSALTSDGMFVKKGTVLARIEGNAPSLLSSERIAVNFLQHLSGIATVTKRFKDKIAGYPVQLLDTRKTLPGYRALEKYAVRMGGGTNHRRGLYDMILIKDNHIVVAGSVRSAIERVLQSASASGKKIECEVTNLTELHQALNYDLDFVLLDNMTPEQMKEAVAFVKKSNALRAKPVLVEASGGVTLETIQSIAQTGVDLISVGSALTLSAPAVDISMEITYQ